MSQPFASLPATLKPGSNPPGIPPVTGLRRQTTMLPEDTVTAECTRLRVSMDTLSRRGLLGDGMKELLLGWLRQIENFGRTIMTYSPSDRKDPGMKLIDSLMEFDAALTAIENNRLIADPAAHELLLEVIGRALGKKVTLDVISVRPDVANRYLKCRVRLTDDELDFILFLSPILDYSQRPLLPRVVHEGAHAERAIHSMLTDRTMHIRRLGEATCDLVGLLMSGPAFLSSTVALLQRIEKQRAMQPDANHPSMITRLSILSSIASDLWVGSRLVQLHADIVAPVANLQPDKLETLEMDQLLREVSDLTPSYSRLSVATRVWEKIYMDHQYNRQGSISIDVNIEFARERTSQ